MTRKRLLTLGLSISVPIVILIWYIGSTHSNIFNRRMLPSSSEQLKIDTWLQRQGKNEYGDPPGTLYTGGTPLYNEVTGKSIDRYTYLGQKFPSEPWDH